MRRLVQPCRGLPAAQRLSLQSAGRCRLRDDRSPHRAEVASAPAVRSNRQVAVIGHPPSLRADHEKPRHVEGPARASDRHAPGTAHAVVSRRRTDAEASSQARASGRSTQPGQGRIVRTADNLSMHSPAMKLAEETAALIGQPTLNSRAPVREAARSAVARGEN